MLDTGDLNLALGELVTNYDSLPNWKGPYINGTSASKPYLTFNTGSYTGTFFVTSVGLNQTKALSSGFSACTVQCMKFFTTTASTSTTNGEELLKLVNSLERYLDSSIDQDGGKIRYRKAEQSGGTYLVGLYYGLGIPSPI